MRPLTIFEAFEVLTIMFVRASNTVVTKTSIALDSGITSLVLIPLPDAQESVEDIGRYLYGLLLGSATLVPHKTSVCRGQYLLSWLELTRVC